MAMSTKDTVAPDASKKRRRRVPTSGAAEDCFGCRKRGVQCDRRRPYCSQCLETSKECPGYRTTLTWGVGVASRGKLRGLSLPVPNSPSSAPSFAAGPTAVGPASIQSSAQARSAVQRPRANTFHEPPSASAADGEDGRRKRVRLTPLKTNHTLSLPPAPTSFPSSFPPYPYQQTDWQQTPPFFPPRHNLHEPSPFPHHEDLYKSRDLFPLHTAVGTSFPSLPWSPSPLAAHAHSVGTPTAESDTSTASYPHTPNATQTFEPYFPQLAASGTAPHQPHMFRGASIPFGWQPTPHEGSATHQQHYLDGAFDPSDALDTSSHLHDADTESVASLIASTEAVSPRPTLHRAYSSPVTYRSVPFAQQLDHSSEPPEDALARQSVLLKADSVTDSDSYLGSLYLFPGPALFQLHPRTQFLLNYYDQAICPALVVQDGPNNPYRQQIMQLAISSPCLQSAIAALATNNIRMRRLKNLPHSDLDLIHGRDKINAAIGVDDTEEQQYKANSVDLLNKQLTDPNKARDDSALATLLILCLFHVCGSGFSKFKTQLAGLQKLLRLRVGFQPSEFVRWVEMFFAWSDTLTSALNDREAQPQIGSMDLSDLSYGLLEAEEYFGCDGILFKLVGRLGRVNLLSQSRPVRDLRDRNDGLNMAPPNDYGSISREGIDLSESYHGDVNRLGSPCVATTTQAPSSPASTSDARQDFWLEWHELRERLQSWQPSPAGDGNAEPRSQHDMQHLSEAFRWAALLYTERLANPSAAPGAPSLQEFVDRTLFHVREIGTSNVTKFLLWPLFVVGTECVEPTQRDVVRSTCVDVLRETGFFNSVAVLEVLERVWAVELDAEREHKIAVGQAFRWRRYMERADGEYMIV